MSDLTGLLFAGAALILWSLSPFFFTGTGKRIGPFATNLLRLLFAFLALCAFCALRPVVGFHAPPPSLAAALWLAASGVIGLTIGDAFLYQAFVTVGPERTSQIQTLAPAATAAIAWIALREFLSPLQMLGMALILGGVLIATTSAARSAHSAGSAAGDGTAAPGETGSGASSAGSGRAPARLLSGAWAAIWSALFQAIGTVLARKGFQAQADLDPILATTIRIGAGTIALWAYARWKGPLRPALGHWTEPRTWRLMAAGVLFGPLVGMVCYVAALKFAPAGIVTTITFMAPLLIIPIGAKLYGTRITMAALCGTALSLGGVVLLGLG